MKVRIRRGLRGPETRTTRSEVVLVLVMTLLAFSLSSMFNLSEWFITQTRQLEAWQIDELPVAFLWSERSRWVENLGRLAVSWQENATVDIYSRES